MLSYDALEIMSYGGGTPSTTLVLMSCENKLTGRAVYPQVPIYDYVLFCDLHAEPSWVYRQVEFVAAACKQADIPFLTLDADLHGDFTNNFGKRRVAAIPFWTKDASGKKGKMPRQCTCDYKINVIEKFVRYEMLGYRPRQRTRECDIHYHNMHMGIMYEERRRAKESRQRLFVNQYPLVEMEWTRSECFAYNKDTWGLETWASSCLFCPFHTNFFYAFLKENEPSSYDLALQFDRLLECNQAIPPLKSSLYISKRYKRLQELTLEDCCDAQTFSYQGEPVWNGF